MKAQKSHHRESFEKARSIYFEGKFDEALQLFENLLKEDLDEYLLPETLRRKADCLSNLGKNEDALALYEEAITLTKTDSTHLCWVYASKANCLAQLGQYQESIHVYKLAIELADDRDDLEHLKQCSLEVIDEYKHSIIEKATKAQVKNATTAIELRLQSLESDEFFNWIEDGKKVCTLQEYLAYGDEWTTMFFSRRGVHLNYTDESLIHIDDYLSSLTEEPKNLVPMLCAFGIYLGETVRKVSGNGQWIGDDAEADGLEDIVNIALRIEDTKIIWPIQRVMKRYQNGSEDSIYLYAQMLCI